MSIRVLRKAVGLFIVDIVLIIGIFVLQFRTDSNIIEKIGNLQVTFTKKEKLEGQTPDTEEGPIELVNKFRVAYNGINLYCEEENPVVVIDNENNSHNLLIEGWERINDLSIVLNFSEGVNIRLSLGSAEPTASLSIITELPENFSEIIIPYSFSSDVKIKKQESTNIVLTKRKDVWEMFASSLVEKDKMSIKAGSPIATYSLFKETEEFTFDSITSLAIADKEVFNENFNSFTTNLISAYNESATENNLNEQIIVSYVAAMAEKGKFKQAVDSIPQSFKKSSQRTYLSAPYFNTLDNMNNLLNNDIELYEQKIAASAANESLDIFTIHNIADFMYIHSNPSVVKKLMENTAHVDVNKISLEQAVGIIDVYVDLHNYGSGFADILFPVVESCVDRVAKACTYESNVLTISDNDTFLSVIQAIETGVAVLRYGLVSGDTTLQKAGYVIINSYLEESSSFDLRTLANLYPILAFDKHYYPHFQKIHEANGRVMWAWTCAKDIKFQQDNEGSMSVTIDFPEGLTHYVIIKGLPKFKSIYIYDMLFRSDYRFETYNSSGYVYKDKMQTLLLKSRHKKRYEEIRFDYTSRPASSAGPKATVTTVTTGAAENVQIESSAVSEETPAIDSAISVAE